TRFSRDWSSDVCSSDLMLAANAMWVDCHHQSARIHPVPQKNNNRMQKISSNVQYPPSEAGTATHPLPPSVALLLAFGFKVPAPRSEERRVGNGGRYRWS